MKKLFICILILMLISGCSTNQAASTPNENSEQEKIEEVTKFDDTLKKESQTVSRGLNIEPAEETDPELYTRYPFNSTDLRFENFDEFRYFLNAIPEGAVFPIVREMEGEWKYNIDLYNLPPNYSRFCEIGYADFEIDYNRELLLITLHPRLAHNGYEMWEESDDEVGYEVFEGGFEDNGTLKFSGNNAIIVIDNYFAYEGREYTTGEIYLSEEVSGYFWMYRGQE